MKLDAGMEKEAFHGVHECVNWLDCMTMMNVENVTYKYTN